MRLTRYYPKRVSLFGNAVLLLALAVLVFVYLMSALVDHHWLASLAALGLASLFAESGLLLLDAGKKEKRPHDAHS